MKHMTRGKKNESNFPKYIPYGGHHREQHRASRVFALLLADVPADYMLYAEGETFDAVMLGIYETAEGR